MSDRQSKDDLRAWGGLLRVILAGGLAVFSTTLPAGADEALGSRQNSQLTILHLADVYEISPVDGGKAGGLARVAALKKSLAEERKNVLLTLGGDFLSPSVASALFQGEQMMETLGVMGLDLATLGNHEFDFGPELLRRYMREAPWEWVVTNIFDAESSEPIGGAEPFLIREFDGLKVGFLGLCLASEEISPDKREGVIFEDPFEAAARTLPLLEAEGADLIVALTHLDFIDDVRLAQRFPQIELILGGHEHFPITTYARQSLITKPGSDARDISLIDISRPTADSLIEKHFELLPVDEELPADQGTAAVVARWEARLDEELEVVMGSTAEPLDAVAENVRSRETNLGNLMTDAMRRSTGADIAILNAGSIRSNRVYPGGELKRRDLVAIHPFGGITSVVEIPGRVVLEALNHGLGRLGESVGRFPQISGIRILVDPERPAGDRVIEAQVGDEPLQPEKTYRVAIGDYMLKGGDGYSMFLDGKVLVGPQAGNLLVNDLAAQVGEGGSVAPRVEGRIAFVGEPAPPPARRGVILDTDMGIDSVIGLLYLLKAPEVQLEAVTTVHGIADLKPGSRNAVRIMELTGYDEIPVARGAKRPLEGRRGFPTFWKPQANTLGGAALPEASRKPGKRAEDLILSTLDASLEPVTLVAMGPLTNIAAALETRPDVVAKIAEIVVMGGALDARGNVGTPYVGIDNYSAEWNFYLDPEAAEKVLASGAKIRLLSLDSSQSLPVTPEFVDRVRTQPRDQTSDLLLALLQSVNEYIEAGWYYFWDALAAVATARTEVVACRQERISVVTERGPDLGQTRRAEGGYQVCVGDEINRQAFEEHLLEAIFD